MDALPYGDQPMANLRDSKLKARRTAARLMLLDAAARHFELNGLVPNKRFYETYAVVLDNMRKTLRLTVRDFLLIEKNVTPGKLDLRATWRASAAFVLTTPQVMEAAKRELYAQAGPGFFSSLSEPAT